MSRIIISIKTLSPVIMSSMSNTTIMTETHSYFSGSIIRGVLASRYVEKQKLGDNAFKNETFRKIFYGGLKFLSANPEFKGKRTFMAPQSLQSGKEGTDNENDIQDLLTTTKNLSGYKSLKKFGIIEKNDFITIKVKKNISMHMSRSGESERLAGRSVDGQIYNYESIDAGQNFQGEIIGDKNLLEKLLNGLGISDKNPVDKKPKGKIKYKKGFVPKENKLDNSQSNEREFTAYIGRSRFTQYGKCLVTLGKVENSPSQIIKPKMYLRLDTPLIPMEDFFISAEKILQEEVADVLEKICGKKFTLGKVFASNTEVENFVAHWGMKRPRVQALAAGTVFELSTDNLTEDNKVKIGAKFFDGFGTRTEEGFGQIRIWDSQNFIKVDGDVSTETFSELSDDIISLAQKIFSKRFLRQIRIYAQEDADKLKLSGNLTHFFSRLENILMRSNKNNVRADFKKLIELEMRDGSLFKDHLKNIYMSNGQTFYDVFTGQANLPYESRDLNKNIPDDLVKLLNLENFNFNNEFCLEYLQTYFKFARKKASGGVTND